MRIDRLRAMVLLLLCVACSQGQDPTTVAPIASASNPASVDALSESVGAVPFFPTLGYVLDPGGRGTVTIGVHCGVQTFGSKLNGRVSHTTEGEGVLDWLPDEWRDDLSGSGDAPTALARLSADGTTLTLARNDRDVIYTASGTEFADDQLCD